MTKTKLSKLLPVRDFPLAVAVAVLAMAFLGLAGHPPEEWPAIVAVFYIAFRLGLTAVMGLLACAAKLLAGYGKQVLRQHGVEISEDRSAKSDSGRGRAWLAAAIVSVVISTTVGGGIFACKLAIAWLGITPLSPVFFLVGWGFWMYGAFTLALMFIAPAMLFCVADIRVRIRIRPSEAMLTSALSLPLKIQAGIPSARNK